MIHQHVPHYLGAQGEELIAALRSQRLACRQFVLSYWKASVSARREHQVVVDRFYKRIHSYTSGRPVQFLRAEVEGVVQGNLDSGTLVPTDFEGMLAKWK